MGDPAIILGWIGSAAPVVAAIVIWGRRIIAAIRKDAETLSQATTEAAAKGAAEALAPVQDHLDRMDTRITEIERMAEALADAVAVLAEESPQAKARLAAIERRAG